MPLKSMTGFGAAREESSGWGLRVEIKAVNHKSLDVRINAPRGWGEFEAKVLTMVRERICRGRMTLTIEASAQAPADGALLGVNEARLEQVIDQLRGIQSRHGLAGELTLSELEPYRHLYMLKEPERAPVTWEQLSPVVDAALTAFDAARCGEGETILELFQGHLAKLGQARERLVELRPVLLEGYAERLRERLLELSERHALDLDQERVIQEVNHFADRTDIAEELQRAGAHLERLCGLLDVEGEPHGKKLDFYLQEMIRETNTMASKSNFSDLTQIVVEMKSWVEQLREQAANVE